MNSPFLTKRYVDSNGLLFWKLHSHFNSHVSSCLQKLTRYYGVHFDYKVGNRHAWLYCTTIILIGLILSAAAFHSRFEYYLDGYSLVNLTKFISSSLHENQMMGSPLITYIYLLRYLQKRYAVLNQMLRYSLSNF